MPRFVVLRHQTPPGYRQGLHWDLMLEEGERLLTWALERPPEEGAVIAATKLPDHRLAYLDYEGPIGGERGEVTQDDRGEFAWLSQSDTRCEALLNGKEPRKVTLTCAEGTRWLARFEAFPGGEDSYRRSAVP